MQKCKSIYCFSCTCTKRSNIVDYISKNRDTLYFTIISSPSVSLSAYQSDRTYFSCLYKSVFCPSVLYFFGYFYFIIFYILLPSCIPFLQLFSNFSCSLEITFHFSSLEIFLVLSFTLVFLKDF